MIGVPFCTTLTRAPCVFFPLASNVAAWKEMSYVCHCSGGLQAFTEGAFCAVRSEGVDEQPQAIATSRTGMNLIDPPLKFTAPTSGSLKRILPARLPRDRDGCAERGDRRQPRSNLCP